MGCLLRNLVRVLSGPSGIVYCPAVATPNGASVMSVPIVLPFIADARVLILRALNLKASAGDVVEVNLGLRRLGDGLQKSAARNQRDRCQHENPHSSILCLLNVFPASNADPSVNRKGSTPAKARLRPATTPDLTDEMLTRIRAARRAARARAPQNQE